MHMNIFQKNLSSIIGIALLLVIAYAANAFNSPTQNPPSGNVNAPVTTNTEQTITGMKTFNPAGLFAFSIDPAKSGIVANLNSDKLDNLNASDLLAQAGGGAGSAGASFVTWGFGTLAGQNAPACPSGWTEAYSGYGPFMAQMYVNSAQWGSVSMSEICSSSTAYAFASPYPNSMTSAQSAGGGGYNSTCRVCVKADPLPSAPGVSVGSTLLYRTVSQKNGNVGGKGGADALCASELPPSLSGKVSNIHAFLSFDGTNEIRDMHNNDSDQDGSVLGYYESLNPIYAYDRKWGTSTRIAGTWFDLLDGSVLVSLNNAFNEAISIGTYPWTGSNNTPASNDGGNLGANCAGFTTTSGSGTFSNFQSTDYLWLGSNSWDGGSSLSCGMNRYLLCTAKYTP